MPFCPKCRYEYRQGVQICPDCGETLVASLPEDIDQDSKGQAEETVYKDWIQLARLTSQQYAELVVEGLRSKGIPAVVLSGTGHFGQLGMMNVSLYLPVGGGYSLMVPREFVDKADEEASLILGDMWEDAKLVDID